MVASLPDGYFAPVTRSTKALEVLPPSWERTKIFFEMPENGSVELDIYSEYGDKIYHTTRDGLSKGINSIEYTGRDDRGDILYNGTYVCVVKKKYLGTTKKEKCRLLVIK